MQKGSRLRAGEIPYRPQVLWRLPTSCSHTQAFPRCMSGPSFVPREGCPSLISTCLLHVCVALAPSLLLGAAAWARFPLTSGPGMWQGGSGWIT